MNGLRGVTRDVALVSVAIFFLDASHSTVIPLFPGFARGIGASLSVLGSYDSVSAVFMFLLAIPLGRLSDRLGRKRMIIPGTLLFILVPLSYILATGPLQLYPIRVGLGLGLGLVFGNGFLLMSEVAEPGFRNTAQGIYMTSMGLGFTLGPLIGGFTAKLYGAETSFMISSALGVAGLLVLSLVRERRGAASGPERKAPRLRDLLADARILASGVANYVNSLMYIAVTLFFPVYGANIGFDEAEVGIGLTSRGLASTLVRLPVGALTRRVKALNLMLLGLAFSAATVYGVSGATTLVLVTALMGLQGVAYGIYLTSGNVYVSEEAPEELRGTAMAVYSMFGNVSGMVNPLLLGVIAESFGGRGAMRFAAGFTVLGIAAVYALARRGTQAQKNDT
ncbi:MAG: MFS transporter [Candidatus Bathyarchaeota archaeon]